jgi:hypothetical protein
MPAIRPAVAISSTNASQAGRSLRLLAAVLAAALLATACNGSFTTDGGGAQGTTPTSNPTPTSTPTSSTVPGDGSTVPPTTEPQSVVQDPAIDERLRAFTAWDVPVHESTDDRVIPAKAYQEGGDNVTCTVTDTRTLAPSTFDDFAAFVFRGEALPGLVVQGDAVLQGDLSPVPVRRAPVSLAMNLASANPTIEVDDPTSSSLTAAVAALKSDADARLIDRDIVPAQIDFSLQESSSYEEAILQMGVSLRYDSPKLRAEFASTYDQQETKAEHTVTMRLLQPMFTISVDRSRIATAGDYLAADAQLGDLDRLVADGLISADNPPLIIDRVTYGRSVYLTISSTEVTSASDLKVAVEGAYGGFSGEGDFNEQHRRIVSNAQFGYEAFGGDQDVALAALKDGDIKGFLREVNTSNAIPLTFGLRTLDGAPVSVTDQATIQDIGCTRTPIPVARTQWAVEAYVGSGWVTMWVNNKEVAKLEWDSSRTVNLTPHMNEGRSNVLEIEVWPATCLANPQVGITLTADGSVKSDRSYHKASCAWKSRWTIDDADNTVTQPDNWS